VISFFQFVFLFTYSTRRFEVDLSRFFPRGVKSTFLQIVDLRQLQTIAKDMAVLKVLAHLAH